MNKMDSEKKQDKKISVSGPGSYLEENIRVRSCKRKANDNSEENPKRHRGSSDGTEIPKICEFGDVLVEAARAGPRKRKASCDKQDNPKKHRDSGTGTKNSDTSGLDNVSVEDVRAGRMERKRKASPDIERPQKRHKHGSDTEDAPTDTCDTVQVSVKAVSAGQKNSSIGENSSKKREEKSSPSAGERETTLPEINTSRADFEEKYEQLDLIGEGGFGCVYAGLRNEDDFPVAIKRVRDPEVAVQIEIIKIPLEVALMQKAAGGPESVGKCAAISLLDWYYIDEELILVMERPQSSMDLNSYIRWKGGCLDEHQAKILMAQLVEGAVEMHRKRVFHRDIKRSNVLVDFGSSVPRVRYIDFGCGSFVRRRPYRHYTGTFELAPPEWYTYKKFKASPTTVWQLGALLYRMLHRSNFSTPDFVKGNIHISSDLSQDCCEFLQQCLTINYKERAKLTQLPLHPWLKTSNT